MPLKPEELIRVVELVAEKRGMQVAVTYSLSGAVFTAATTFAGGILGGPVGLALGGIFGGVTSGAMSNGKFKSVVDVIRNDLTQREKAQLVEHLEKFVEEYTVFDALEFASLILSSSDIQALFIKSITSFFWSQLNRQVNTTKPFYPTRKAEY